ncbi:MAG: sigma-70 family RNA polymerase sigma factor [Acidobacteriota bacterium]
MAVKSPGSAERLDALLAEHGRLLKSTVARVCPRYLGIQPDEIEQEVRVRLWRVLESEREITDPASYIRRVAVTASIDAIRRAKVRKEEPLMEIRPGDESGDVFGAPRALPDSAPNPEAEASAREIGRKVEAALSRIPESRRRVVRLHLQQFNTQEMASLLGWSEPKARNLVYRGLRDLRRELRAQGIDCEAIA